LKELGILKIDFLTKIITMKNKKFLQLGLVALVSIFAWQSCSLVEVNSPDIDVTQESTLEYYLKGVVSNADNSQGIEGATITIGDISITSDAEGNYSYNSKTQFANGSIVKVVADDYVLSTSIIRYGENAPIEYFLDFTLTRQSSANSIDLIAGDELLFDGGKIIIPANNSVTLNGETLDNIEMSISPLSPISTLGNWVGASLKKLKLEPAGAIFDIPVIVEIDMPENFDYSEVLIYSFNEAINTWDNIDCTVTYNGNNNYVSFELKILPDALHAVDPASIEITFDSHGDIYNIIDLFETAVRYEPNTCDCETPFSWFGGNYIRKVELVDSVSTGSLNELNSLHFFSTYNMPYNTTLVNGIFVVPAVPAPGIPIGTCEQMNVDVSRQYREVTGTYDYEGEVGKTFTVRYYYAVTVAHDADFCFSIFYFYF